MTKEDINKKYLVFKLNSKSSFIQQIKVFRNFVSNNKVNTIDFVDFNKTIEGIMTLYAKKAGININNTDLTNERQKHR